MKRSGRRHRQPNMPAGKALKTWFTARNLVVGVVAGGLAFLAAGHSLAQVSKRQVLDLGPLGQHNSGPLRSVVNDTKLGQPIKKPAEAVRAARATLAFAPLNPSALSLIGLVKEQRRDAAGARRAMETAVRISRRDPVAQLWLGQQAVKGGDLTQVLSRFDLVMRTQPVARPLVFDALGQTLATPEMRREIQPYLRQSNDWFEGFALAAAEKPDTSLGFAETLLLQRRPLPDSAPLRNAYASIVRQLAAQRRYATIKQLFPRLPAAPMGALQSATLPKAGSADYAPATWWFVTNPSVGSSLNGQGADQLLEIYAANGASGLAARKLLMLPSGQYSARWQIVENSTNPDAQLRFAISCTGSADDRLMAEAVKSADKPDPQGAPLPTTAGRLSFEVPETGCSVLYFDVRANGGRNRDEARWLVDSISIVPSKSR